MDANKPTTIVIFGATGNLAQKKLIPALYHLFKGDLLPQECTIVCIARDPNANLELIVEKAEIALLHQEHDADEQVLDALKSRMRLHIMDSTNQDDFHHLREVLDGIDTEKGVAHNRLFYLAIPPAIFQTVISCLGNAGLNNEDNGRASRILVEKPFGTDLESAKQLVDHINLFFGEHQVYRIDHYLAKETAQNLLAFRYNNPLIEDLWGRQFIDHIQITAAETIDIEGRANFYEGMGAMRDLVQSHLLQLMALTMMEVPYPLNAENIHTEKQALLDAIRPIKPNHIDEVAVRGQYNGYRDEVQNQNSTVETYAALHLEVSNSRWGGVPVLVRTGKALAEKMTEITVVFRDRSRRKVEPNLLTIRIQPNEGIGIKLQAKRPGFTDDLQPVDMEFRYQTAFKDVQPDAYERVLMDAIDGDQSLFATSSEVLRCWEILQPVLESWQIHGDDLKHYDKGTWGPDAADELAKSYGCQWLSNSPLVDSEDNQS
ncbi:MAG: glucose-6-phosphate dehydrogenase [Candidatus Saccharimonadales bacterium]